MLSPRIVTLSAAVLLGLSLVVPASEVVAKARAGQPAVKASRLSTVNDGATKDLRDLVKEIDQNRQKKSNIRR